MTPPENPDDFQPVRKGLSRRYKDPDGKEISYRQFFLRTTGRSLEKATVERYERETGRSIRPDDPSKDAARGKTGKFTKDLRDADQIRDAARKGVLAGALAGFITRRQEQALASKTLRELEKGHFHTEATKRGLRSSPTFIDTQNRRRLARWEAEKTRLDEQRARRQTSREEYARKHFEFVGPEIPPVVYPPKPRLLRVSERPVERRTIYGRIIELLHERKPKPDPDVYPSGSEGDKLYRRDKNRWDKEYGPRGRIANLLVVMGRRKPTDDWDVGDTPD